MIVTTGGRGTRSASSSSYSAGSSSSSAACLDRDLALDLGRDQLDLLVGKRLGRGSHLAERHEDLDQLGHRDAERGGQVLDGRARLDDRRPGRRSDGRLLARRPDSEAVARGCAALAAARAASLDDHAPLASCGASREGESGGLVPCVRQPSVLNSRRPFERAENWCPERRRRRARRRAPTPTRKRRPPPRPRPGRCPAPGSGSVPTSAW